jgi:hypothetical protein
MQNPCIMINATPAQLRKAADIQERIQLLQAELTEILGDSSPALSPAAIKAPKRRKVSAAGKARMRAAQLARWAKIKGTAPATTPAKKAKKRFSPAARAALAAAAKARWAKVKAAGKSRL